MLASISSSQLAEWEAFFLLEPWGSEVDAYRIGQVCATIANWAGMRIKEGHPPMTPMDFMPSLDPRKDGPPPDQRKLSAEIHAAFTAMAS